METLCQPANEKSCYDLNLDVKGKVELAEAQKQQTPFQIPRELKPFSRALIEVDRIRAEVEAVLESSFTKSCSCGLDFQDLDTFDEHHRYSGHGKRR